MGSITRQSWREKPYTVPANQSYEIDFIDSDPNYVVIYNKSNQQLYVSRYPGASATSYDFTVPPLSNRQWGWDGPLKNLYIFQGGPGTSNINLTSYAAAFDPAAVAQSGQNVLVANDLNIASMPAVQIASGTINVGNSPAVTVTAGTLQVTQAPGNTLNVGGTVQVGNSALNVQNTSGGTLNVAGTVQIGNTPSVNIANTVNANITAGSVNATIQNASLNSNITNALIGNNPSILLTKAVSQTITNLANGSTANMYPTPSISIPLVLVDSITLILISSIADPNTLYNISSIVPYNNIPNSNLGLTNVQFISSSGKTANYKADLPYGFPTNNCMFTMVNKSGALIANDTLTMYVLIKYASVSNKPIQDSITYYLNAYTGTIINSGGLIKQLSFTIQNQESTAKTVNVMNGGQIIQSIIMPGGSGSTTSAPYNFTFGNGVANNGITVSVTGTAGGCFISGYGLTA